MGTLGDMTALSVLMRHLRAKAQVTCKWYWGLQKQSIMVRHPLLRRCPLPGTPPRKGPVFFINHSVGTSLVSPSQGAFPEARDPYETFHTCPPTPTASAGSQPDL